MDDGVNSKQHQQLYSFASAIKIKRQSSNCAASSGVATVTLILILGSGLCSTLGLWQYYMKYKLLEVNS